MYRTGFSKFVVKYEPGTGISYDNATVIEYYDLYFDAIENFDITAIGAKAWIELLKGERIKNVEDAEKEYDAVNLRTLNKRIKEVKEDSVSAVSGKKLHIYFNKVSEANEEVVGYVYVKAEEALTEAISIKFTPYLVKNSSVEDDVAARASQTLTMAKGKTEAAFKPVMSFYSMGTHFSESVLVRIGDVVEIEGYELIWHSRLIPIN